ncbi:MAG: hypothetical protein ABSH20_03565 [Tepidisphaeraceae bacterium]|jgi:hypothetical protein
MKAKPAGQPALPPNPSPFKPRPVLFVSLLAVFLLWIGWLLYLYFTTVFPYRGK